MKKYTVVIYTKIRNISVMSLKNFKLKLHERNKSKNMFHNRCKTSLKHLNKIMYRIVLVLKS